MGRYLCGVMLAVLAASLPDPAAANSARVTAGEMLERCRPVALASGSEISTDSYGGYCIGYIQGARDALALNPSMICIPHEASSFQLVRVYVKWAEDHPEEHHLDAFLGVLASLRGGFPCP